MRPDDSIKGYDLMATALCKLMHCTIKPYDDCRDETTDIAFMVVAARMRIWS